MEKKWVYLFDELDQVNAYVGGVVGRGPRAAGRQGGQPGRHGPHRVPVPPGFTVTTEACNAYLAAGEQFPEGMWEQELAALRKVERADRQEASATRRTRCWSPAAPAPSSRCPA
ncbi:MAG: hypothetical protein MZU91_13545 [Desulfosudis oleivorans]|nr:hypothetical protein [Desulfosudis oleivorans]